MAGRASTEPTQTTTVTLGSLDAGATTIGGGPLVFDSANWSTAQTVTACAADDDAQDESTALAATSTTATASEYAGLSACLAATVDDDETLSVLEADSAEYTAQLSAQPVNGNVAVAITRAPATASRPTRPRRGADNARTTVLSALASGSLRRFDLPRRTTSAPDHRAVPCLGPP